MDVKITADKKHRQLTAQIIGELDHHTAKYIRGNIDMAIKENNPQTLIIDFSEVTFMDSSGIGLVMGRYKIMNELSGIVMIANPPPYIRRVMQLSGIDKLCKIINHFSDHSHTDDEQNRSEIDNCESLEQCTKENAVTGGQKQ